MVRVSTRSSAQVASSAATERSQSSAWMIGRLAQQRAAELGLLVDQDHARAAAAGGERRHQPGGTAADHEHVAVRVHVLVAIRIGRGRRPAQAGGAADQPLVHAPPPALRPHEGLVVEARREQRAEDVVQRPQVEADGWPAVLARGSEAVVQLDLGGADVGLGARAAAQLHERVRLLGAGAEDAARAVILEAAPDQMDAVRQQRRSERVAGVALVAGAVEGEMQRLPPIDPAAAVQAVRLSLAIAESSRRLVGAGADDREIAPARRSGPARCRLDPRPRLAHRVDLEDPVAHRVAGDIEPAPAAVHVAPALEMQALGIAAHEQVVGPLASDSAAGCLGRAMCASPWQRNSVSSRSPHQGQGIRSMACLKARDL